MKKFNLTNAIILSSVLIYGCSDQHETKQTNNPTNAVASQSIAQEKPVQKSTSQTNQNFPHPVVTPANTPQNNKILNSGIVEQVLHSGGYTYINANIGEKTVWLAGSQTPVKEGQEVYWADHAVMRNFKSKSLDKTFDAILFVSGFSTNQQVASQPNSVNTAASTVNSASVNNGKVISSQNAAGYSYVEVDANGNTLWIAAPETSLRVNDQISWNGASKMKNFTSKSLHKTFKEILFVASVQISSK